MHSIAYIIAAFLSSFGFICLLYTLFCSLFSLREEPLFILLPVGEQAEDIELRIKQARRALKCLNGRGEKSIIVLDNGMSEMTRQIVLKEAEDSENIFIMQANELQKLQ